MSFNLYSGLFSDATLYGELVILRGNTIQIFVCFNFSILVVYKYVQMNILGLTPDLKKAFCLFVSSLLRID